MIRALREAGHDITSIAETSRGASDEEVLDYAAQENRVLITEERDFGELVYARGHSAAGVVLIRFHSSVRIA